MLNVKAKAKQVNGLLKAILFHRELNMKVVVYNLIPIYIIMKWLV